MLKVAIVINSLNGGGAERVVSNLSSFLAHAGYDVSVITLHDVQDSYALPKEIRRYFAGGGTLRGSLGAAQKVFSIRNVLKRTKPDYVLCMMTVPCILTMLASIGLPVQVVVSERNHPPRKHTPLHWRLLRWALYRYSYASVVLTARTAIWMKQIGCKTVHVVPVSVALPLPTLEPYKDPSAFIGPDEFVFLGVGRLHPQKGFDLLIKAFSDIAPRLSNARLVLLGEGDEWASLINLTIQYQIQDRVSFIGRAGNISDWYARADAFVFSSRFEGFGNALVEAMASGCACISFDCEVGPAEVIEHDKDGWLVPAENIALLAQGMTKLYTDDSLRLRLAKKAQEKGLQYSEQKVLKQWLEIFR